MFDTITPIPQIEGDVIWANKISPAEAEIDFTQRAELIERRIRAFALSPGAWFSVDDEDGKPWRIKVLEATIVPAAESADDAPGAFLGRGPGGGPLVRAGDAAVELDSVQPQGRPAMDGASFLNGYALPPLIGRRD